jgi:hypothetical protein
MKKETLCELQIYYGNLMQEYETSKDCWQKLRISKKMKAIEILLDIDFIA